MRVVRSVDEMRELGSSIASKTKVGDLIVLSGPLGAGKTALTQGLGLGLGTHQHSLSHGFTKLILL